MTRTEEIAALSDAHLMRTYKRAGAAFVRGEGARLWDAEGAEYVDFLAGIATANLGHAHPGVAKAIAEQAATLVHTSNLYLIAPQAELARKLCERSFGSKVFFCNSGAEANEAALKLARKVAAGRGRGYGVVATRNSFHGRTMLTLSATGQEKIHAGFYPLVEGFRHVAFGDAAMLEAAIDDTIGAVMLEPIQGEGGVVVPPDGYLRRVRELCDAHGLLLVYDEVQTGMGRTGTLFAYEQTGAAPDVMTLAKALGNGAPIGAMVASEDAAAYFQPGDHGSTFGGNFLVTAAANAVMDAMTAPGFLERVRETGAYFEARLREIAARFPWTRGVRGRGMMWALVLGRDPAPVQQRLFQKRLLAATAGGEALRFLPPLVIAREEIDRGMAILAEALEEAEA